MNNYNDYKVGDSPYDPIMLDDEEPRPCAPPQATAPSHQQTASATFYDPIIIDDEEPRPCAPQATAPSYQQIASATSSTEPGPSTEGHHVRRTNWQRRRNSPSHTGPYTRPQPSTEGRPVRLTNKQRAMLIARALASVREPMNPATHAAAVGEAERMRQEADRVLQALRKPEDQDLWKELEYKLLYASLVLNLWWVDANGNIVLNPEFYGPQNE
jgi:hypothetical protein